MTGIGSEVVALRHPQLADIKRRSPSSYWATTIGNGVFIVIAAAIAVFMALVHDYAHLIAGAVLVLVMLVMLPGLLRVDAERKTERLLIGSQGLQTTVQVAPGLPVLTSVEILWQDLKRAKLAYRSAEGAAVGVRLETRSGLSLFLSASDWVKEDASGSELLALHGFGLTGTAHAKLELLQGSDVVKVLQAKGVHLEDDLPRFYDKLAMVIGLTLAAIVLVLALSYGFFG